MATAAIGGSHLVASTQAGALFGWQLFGLIILINVLKYPFFRFAVDYTMNQRESLVHGYFRQGRSYLVIFYGTSSCCRHRVNTAGVLLLTANLLKFMLPGNLDIVVVSALLFAWLRALSFAWRVPFTRLTRSSHDGRAGAFNGCRGALRVCATWAAGECTNRLC